MKNNILAALLLCAASAACAQSVEYLRPTADADSTNTALITALNIPGNTSNCGSQSLSVSYSGKTGAGPTGAYASETQSSGTNPGCYALRVLKTWQSATKTYTTLTLNVNTQCFISDSGDGVGGGCAVAYSLNSGTSWTALYNYFSSVTANDSQTTHTVTIPAGTTLSTVQIGVAAIASRDDGGAGNDATINVQDSWTAGTYGSSGHVIPPQIISKLHLGDTHYEEISLDVATCSDHPACPDTDQPAYTNQLAVIYRQRRTDAVLPYRVQLYAGSG